MTDKKQPTHLVVVLDMHANRVDEYEAFSLNEAEGIAARLDRKVDVFCFSTDIYDLKE